MGLKGKGLGALGDKKKKTTHPQNFTIFIIETFHFYIQPNPYPVPRSKNFLYRSAPDNLITLVIFRVNGSVAMIIDFFFLPQQNVNIKPPHCRPAITEGIGFSQL